MSTTIRPALSCKNKYWIDRHRYYELKHFCLQYGFKGLVDGRWILFATESDYHEYLNKEETHER